MTVSDDKYFLFQNNDNTVLTELDDRGLLFIFNGSTFVIYNLKEVAAGKEITFNISLTLPL